MDEGGRIRRKTSYEEQVIVALALGFVDGERTEGIGSASFVYLFKKCKHRSVMELRITVVRCNQVISMECIRNVKIFRIKHVYFFRMKMII